MEVPRHWKNLERSDRTVPEDIGVDRTKVRVLEGGEIETRPIAAFAIQRRLKSSVFRERVAFEIAMVGCDPPYRGEQLGRDVTL